MQARIDALSEERAQAKAKVEEMRYSGPGVGGSRRVVDEFDSKVCGGPGGVTIIAVVKMTRVSQLSEASSKCEKNRKRFNRVLSGVVLQQIYNLQYFFAGKPTAGQRKGRD